MLAVSQAVTSDFADVCRLASADFSEFSAFMVIVAYWQYRG
jgi:hypothetical protein